MKLSKRTIGLLKNYASINPSIFIPAGNLLQTIAISKNIVSYSEADESFPVDFAIYDLFEFLSVIDLFKDPDFEFEDNSVTISDDGSKCTYIYAEKTIIEYPKHKLNFPAADIQFKLTKDQLEKLLKAANTLGLPTLCITKDGTNIIVKVVDPKNPTSNSYSCVVGEDTSSYEYEFYIKHEHMKMVKDDYDVAISRKLISQFISTDQVEYYCALEKNSTFSE